MAQSPADSLWEVYPACAGIDLVFHTFTTAAFGLPRMRGDRPPIEIKEHVEQ